MNKTEKLQFTEDLQERLSEASAFYLTDFTGMSVKQMTRFRRKLRDQGVEYVVVKNTLAQRAVTALDMADIAGFFTGPTGVVIGREDPVGAAKVLTDSLKEFDNKPVIKAGVVDRKEIQPDDIRKLAELPPREVLLAQLAGGLQAPMARLAGGMQNLLAGLARAFDALRQQREGEGAGS
jgi:large subunit ribosomal protein L10